MIKKGSRVTVTKRGFKNITGRVMHKTNLFKRLGKGHTTVIFADDENWKVYAFNIKDVREVKDEKENK